MSLRAPLRSHSIFLARPHWTRHWERGAPLACQNRLRGDCANDLDASARCEDGARVDAKPQTCMRRTVDTRRGKVTVELPRRTTSACWPPESSRLHTITLPKRALTIEGIMLAGATCSDVPTTIQTGDAITAASARVIAPAGNASPKNVTSALRTPCWQTLHLGTKPSSANRPANLWVSGICAHWRTISSCGNWFLHVSHVAVRSVP